VPAAVIQVGGLFALYLTPLYAATLQSGPLHAAVSLHFFLAGCLFTWSVAGPDPAPRRPGVGVRVAVLVVAAAAHAFLAKLLYAHAAALPPGTAFPVARVEQAAGWMYYGGDLAELALAVLLFGDWYHRRVRTGARRAMLRRRALT
jgi:putative membrane protein